ncbi:hypothetical protein JCM10213_004676 [Rhodosporidiobolus nylandii]
MAPDARTSQKHASVSAQAVREAPEKVLPVSEGGAVGRREDAFYARLMPAWRVRVRQWLVRSLEREMGGLQRIQETYRTPWRDEYFVKTSLLGTHTFFMLFLPLWYWFGLPEVGRGLLYVLALGAYATGAFKDAFSVPRPFSPPVTRLSVGSHALEYGFPSTHSSNACSMALFCAANLVERNTGEMSWLNPLGLAACAVFAWSVVFGRLYTGMHSRADVLTGSSIGIAIWWLHHRYAAALDGVMAGSGWKGTLGSAGALFLLLSTHPEPAEPCPCFEDTVAFLSVVQGAMIGLSWAPRVRPTSTVGWGWGSPEEVAVWSAGVGGKLVGGISAILVWRIVAKHICHAILPPIFRLFARAHLVLPRRGYQVATEYDVYPEEPKLDPVPSILDLPALVEDAAVSSAATSSSSLAPPSTSSRRARPTVADRKPPISPTSGSASSAPHHTHSSANGGEEHKDVDVLTKVVVYAGIGWIATIALPSLFETLGVSVWR